MVVQSDVRKVAHMEGNVPTLNILKSKIILIN